MRNLYIIGSVLVVHILVLYTLIHFELSMGSFAVFEFLMLFIGTGTFLSIDKLLRFNSSDVFTGVFGNVIIILIAIVFYCTNGFKGSEGSPKTITNFTELRGGGKLFFLSDGEIYYSKAAIENADSIFISNYELKRFYNIFNYYDSDYNTLYAVGCVGKKDVKYRLMRLKQE